MSNHKRPSNVAPLPSVEPPKTTKVFDAYGRLLREGDHFILRAAPGVEWEIKTIKPHFDPNPRMPPNVQLVQFVAVGTVMVQGGASFEDAIKVRDASEMALARSTGIQPGEAMPQAPDGPEPDETQPDVPSGDAPINTDTPGPKLVLP